MKTYRSRISILLATILAIAFLFSIWTLFVKAQPATVNQAIMNIAILVFFVFIVLGGFHIRYTILEEEKQLVISSFFGLLRNRIDITQMKRICKSRNLLSSPAASLKRICIEYGKGDAVLISPRGQEEFLEDLKKINPNIEFNL